MRRLRLTRTAVLLAALSASVLLRAQSLPQVDPSAVPIEQEPRHHLVFVNDYVRIIDALLPAFYVSQNHTHTLDNVAITIVPGVDGPLGQARIGFAGYSRGGYTHVITNPNNAPMRFIAVELKAPDHGAPIDEVPQPDHTTVLANAHVRITRVKLTAGETVPDHQHPNGYVSVVVRGAEPGTWRWHPSGEAAAPLDAGRQPLEIVEVEPR